MKRLLLVVALVMLVTALQAKDKRAFVTGTVVLHSGDSIQCKLRFTRKVSEGLIQILVDSTMQMLTVKHVSSFFFYDDSRQAERVFYNVSLMPELSSRKHEVFVERMHANNDIAIVKHRAIGYSKKWQLNPFRKKAVVDEFYLLDLETRKVLPLNKENIIAMMKEDKKTIEGFLETSSLKFRRVTDYITVLDFQQSLH